MRRLLLLVALLLGSASPASAQWGETPAVDLGAGAVATCLRDAGGGRVASLATSGRRYGTAFFRVAPEGLQPDGKVLFGRRLPSCPAVAAAESGAALAVAVVQRRRVARLLVSVREAGGGFGAPVEVARADGRMIARVAAVGADGSAAVA